jgi:ribosomal protein S18 acetylase RimI-like enzyme
MSQPEYEKWRRSSIASYAEENVAAGSWSREEAAARSEKEFAELLPDGLATPGNHLLSVVRPDGASPVGVVWFAVREDGGRRYAFVYDFLIFEEHRRKGHGTQALLLLDGRVRAMGIDSISLHVFAHNAAARGLYEKAGYRETDVMMTKTLG